MANEYSWQQKKVQTTWNMDTGLPSNNALSIIQTKEGYVWIGSYDGLIRFDGNEFSIYNKGSKDEFDANSAGTLFEDSNHRLWIGTNGDGLAVYENNQFAMYTEKKRSSL